jgi:CRISPR-associated protein Cas2
MENSRFNAYRIMWILVFYDLPTITERDRKAHTKFRKQIVDGGFQMFQWSIYVRHCSSKENSDVHTQRIKNILPDKGHVGIIAITDKQFEQIEIYHGKKRAAPPQQVQQLELF